METHAAVFLKSLKKESQYYTLEHLTNNEGKAPQNWT